jgi:hypothetical protein
MVVFTDVTFDPTTYVYKGKEGPLKLEFWNERGFHLPWRHIIMSIIFS